MEEQENSLQFDQLLTPTHPACTVNGKLQLEQFGEVDKAKFPLDESRLPARRLEAGFGRPW